MTDKEARDGLISIAVRPHHSTLTTAARRVRVPYPCHLRTLIQHTLNREYLSQHYPHRAVCLQKKKTTTRDVMGRIPQRAGYLPATRYNVLATESIYYSINGLDSANHAMNTIQNLLQVLWRSKYLLLPLHLAGLMQQCRMIELATTMVVYLRTNAINLTIARSHFVCQA